MTNEIKELREKAIRNLEHMEKLLALPCKTARGDEDLYFDACGRVWAFEAIDLITLDEAFEWIGKYADLATAEGVRV